jgi:hypothetical protein
VVTLLVELVLLIKVLQVVMALLLAASQPLEVVVVLAQ